MTSGNFINYGNLIVELAVLVLAVVTTFVTSSRFQKSRREKQREEERNEHQTTRETIRDLTHSLDKRVSSTEDTVSRHNRKIEDLEKETRDTSNRVLKIETLKSIENERT